MFLFYEKTWRQLLNHFSFKEERAFKKSYVNQPCERQGSCCQYELRCLIERFGVRCPSYVTQSIPLNLASFSRCSGFAGNKLNWLVKGGPDVSAYSEKLLLCTQSMYYVLF